ncbi:hypothetical protein [Kitasatospora sp. MAP5-34]|uniref:hypothetical protein n=1 Tax=Kitasatospora sp. MAP5-34 TaxID=3035102 RepID=UPI002475EDE0|nr:hypothetical protein [Kitasatospora sp. MAP5-34]MDH6580894.1 hypothetical protein [Kitasatospora sp. MAP5-34]
MSKYLARAILEQLPPDRLAPSELAGFEANAAAWETRGAEDVPGREGVNGFGFDSITPEATQLALVVAHTAMDIVVESGLRALWKRLRGRPKRPTPLTSAQLLEVRSRVLSTVRSSGASEDTATLFADAVVEALKQGEGDEEAA